MGSPVCFRVSARFPCCVAAGVLALSAAACGPWGRDDLGLQRQLRLRAIAQIGGASFAVARAGDLVYLGVGSRMVVLDVSDPTRPEELGQGTVLPRVVRDIVVAGGLAYVAADRAGLHVLDVSDPARIRSLSSHDTESQSLALALAGDRLYLAASKDGLLAFDVSDPTAPRLNGRFPPSDRFVDVAVAGERAYVADRDRRISVLDIGDPTAMRTVGQLVTEGHPERLALSAGHLYVTTDRDEMIVVTTRDPERMSVVGSAGIAAVCERDLCSPPDVVVVDDTAYVTGDDLAVFDVADPTLPRLLNAVAPRDPDDPQPVYGALAVTDGMAVITRDIVGGWDGGQGGLSLVDVSVPATPREIGRFETPGQISWPSLAGLESRADTVSRSELLYGHYRVDVREPTAPRRAGVVPFEGFGEVAVADGLAYATGWPHILRVIDLADGDRPVEVGSLSAPADAHGWGQVRWHGQHVALAPGRAFVAGGAAPWGAPVLGVVDVSDPASPRLLGSIGPAADGLEANAERVAASPDGRYVYVAEGWTDGDVVQEDAPGHLEVVDARHPASLRVVGRLPIGETDGIGGGAYPWPGGASDMVVHDGIAYVAAEKAGLRVVDVGRPEAPREIGALDFGDDSAQRVALDWPYAFVAVARRVVAVDVRDPSAPRAAATLDVPGRVRALTVHRGVLWAAMDEAGLVGLRLEPVGG